MHRPCGDPFSIIFFNGGGHIHGDLLAAGYDFGLVLIGTGCRSTAVLGRPTALASTFFASTTVLGSTVISSIAQQPPASRLLITSVQMLSQEFFPPTCTTPCCSPGEQSHGLRRARAIFHGIAAVAQRDHDLVSLAFYSRAIVSPWTRAEVLVILFAYVSGERSVSSALPSGVFGSPMRS